jgi:peptidyl-prolyl cis-trans isomerase SurA
MRLRLLIALVLAAFAATGAAAAQTPFRPVAVVNDSAITGFDLAQRALILSALGYPAETQQALQTAALDQLVEDKLKLQAGSQIGVTATPELIASGIEEYARRAGMTPEAFREAMRGQGVTEQALDDMVAAQVVWLDVIRRRFGDRVQPAEAEIDAEMAQSGAGTATEYRVLEIGLPLTADGRTEAETRALAGELAASLGQGGDFGQAVARHSSAPSAARGGEVGWVTTDRMPPELRQALDALEIGEVSQPLEVPGGLTILKVEDKRVSAGQPQADQATREAVRDQLIAERSARLAEGLLQEMRRDALIDVR